MANTISWQWWLFQQSGRIFSGVMVWVICKLIKNLYRRYKMALIHGKGLNDMPNNWYKQLPENRKIYDLWCNMFRKCYPRQKFDKLEKYKGCTVCDRWCTLSNFIEDLETLPGYDKWQDFLNGGPKTHFCCDKQEFGPKTCYFSHHSSRRRWVEDEG